MGTYTPNYGLYKPDVGETDWGDKVNANFDTIDSEMNKNRSDIDNILNNIIPSLRDDIACNETLISKIKKDVLTIALNVMMHKALLHAETKDFYSIIADVITDEYPNGYKNTFETLPTGVTFDNDGGGTWTQAIKITLTTVPSEYAQYRIVIQSNTMQIYSADGTLKADYGASTGVASEFWNNVKSDGSDIRIADQDYSQLYFWIEEFDYANKKAVIWVRIPANTTELYIAYGNADALPSAYSNGEQVFEFFDDFEGAELDTAKWTANGVGVTVADGVVTISGGNGKLYSAKTFPSGHIVEAKAILPAQPRANFTYGAFGFDLCDVLDNWGTEALMVNHVDPYYAGNTYKFMAKNSAGSQDIETGVTADSNFHTFRIAYMSGEAKLWIDDNLVVTATAYIPTSPLHVAFFKQYNARNLQADWVRVLKLADPADFGTAEVITLTTTGAFITVTFDFPEGIDKLLITVDTDATAIYYSTDDGQTWNAIEPDTETPLPETAYSVKWKFENATYVRGYAFITW